MSVIQPADLFHPLASPYTRIKIGDDTEGPRNRLLKSFLKEVSADHDQIIVPVGINKILHFVHECHLELIRNAPLQKIPLLVFPENIFSGIVCQVIGHADAIAQLNFPAAHISVNAESLISQKRRAESKDKGFSAAACDLLSEPLHFFRVGKIHELTAVHAAEDTVLCENAVQPGFQGLRVPENIPG